MREPPPQKPLFAYGTFRRNAWRDAILGAAYPARPATLRGYRRVACGSGYLSLRETLFDVNLVEGVLVDLDALGWRIADRWEEVPAYRRIDVLANSMDGPVEAVAYVCSDERDMQPVDDDSCLALISDADVQEAIAIFGPRMRAYRRADDE